MKFANKVVVAVGVDGDVKKQLEPLKKMSFLSHSEIHFVHVFNLINYVSYIAEFPIVYPVESDRKILQQSMLSLMTKMVSEVLAKDFEGKVIVQCLFDESPKAKFCEYVKEVHADTVIISTREKHGFFDSSFAQYVNKHSSANMIFLKRNV
jgi:hypothetical protein